MPVLPQVAISFVRLLYAFWLQNGVAKNALDDILRMDLEHDGHKKFGISSEQLAKLHRVAIEQTADLSLGIKLGQSLAKEDLTLANLLLKAPSLEHGLHALLAHSRVISESGYFTLTELENDKTKLEFTAHDGVAFSSHQKDMVFATIIEWIRSVFLDADESLYYHFDSNCAEVDDLARLLDCQLVASEQVFLEISADLIQRTNPNFDEDNYQKSLRQVEKILTKRNKRLELYVQVKEAIKQCLLQRKATQENVASELNLSVRNLQRRLKEAGTSYQAILDDSREELSMKLLKTLDVPLYEISFLVGFTEPSAFYKAFKRWTGKRPGDYRQDADCQSKEVLAVKAKDLMEL